MGLPISQVVPSGFVFTSEGPHYSLAFFFCQAIPNTLSHNRGSKRRYKLSSVISEKKNLLVQKNIEASKKT